MYELLLRTETLFWGLPALVLLIIGAVALGVGLVLWRGGTRHSAVIIGLLGAVIGSALGLLASQLLSVSPWLSMAIGAVVLGGISILLRNVLILILAVLVFAAFSGGGYLAVVLDRAVPQARPETRAQQSYFVQSFSAMDQPGRLAYMNEISNEKQTFGDRLKALLANTGETIRPYFWKMVLATLAGAVVGIVLVWFVAKIVMGLAYSIVGTAAIFLGVQAALLAASYGAVSSLADHRGALPIAFSVMIVIGWLWQLFSSSRQTQKGGHEKQTEVHK